jgi:hypothetical protein
MSNDIISSIQNDLAIIGGLDEDTKAVAGGGLAASKRISIKGGVFRKIAGGKEIGAIEDRHMNVIFVKMAHNPSRTYYSAAYKEGEKISPACWSSDGKVPDAEVKSPQASKCELCPMSAKGSSPMGSGSACRMSWRTAVVLPNDPSGDIMQLVLPATSAFGKEESGKYPFRPYVQMLANHGVSAGRVVTKMQFDTKSPVPRVLFSPVSAINPNDLDVLTAQSKKPAAEAAIKLTVYQSDEGEATTEAPAPAAVVVKPSKKSAATAATADVGDVLKEWTKK